MKQENELGLRISAKYNRIYIHRATLKAIGNPEFVSLGIHPQSGKLVVLAADEREKDALRVRYTAKCCWTASAQWRRRSARRIPACFTANC